MSVFEDVRKMLRDAPEKKMGIVELSNRLAEMGSLGFGVEAEDVVFDMVRDGELEYDEFAGCMVILLPEKEKLARKVRLVLDEIALVEPRYHRLKKKLEELQALCKDPKHSSADGTPCPACAFSLPNAP